MLFQFKLLSQKILKSFTNIEKIKFSNIFTFRDVLFTFLKCALLWANSKRKLSWNETITIRGTKLFYLHSNQISMKPAFKMISFCLIKSNTQRHMQFSPKIMKPYYVHAICSYNERKNSLKEPMDNLCNDLLQVKIKITDLQICRLASVRLWKFKDGWA